VKRRAFIASAPALLALQAAAASSSSTTAVAPLRFPRDHGAHPDTRIEWWYLTGWLDAPGRPSIGLQLTFFRVRTSIARSASRFSPDQLLIGHVAIADPAVGALLHEARVQRAGSARVFASIDDTNVQLDRWSLVRDAASGSYRAKLPTRVFDIELSARPTQPVLLQGDGGVSRKGPGDEQFSLYYSQPQLALEARVRRDNATQTCSGTGWLDHEWSDSILGSDAAGWDWIGINLDDGSALTAFQIRPRAAGPAISAYASLRKPNAALVVYRPDEVRFEPVRLWRSPRTGAAYPVAQRIRVGDRVFETSPLMNDQELDTRPSIGAVYWEGASTLIEGGKRVGRGYLEMTGYLSPLRM